MIGGGSWSIFRVPIDNVVGFFLSMLCFETHFLHISPWNSFLNQRTATTNSLQHCEGQREQKRRGPWCEWFRSAVKWADALTGFPGWTQCPSTWAKFLAMCASPLWAGSSSLCRGPGCCWKGRPVLFLRIRPQTSAYRVFWFLLCSLGLVLFSFLHQSYRGYCMVSFLSK